MAAISSLVKNILMDIPEIPGFIAQQQYARAMRELCEEARVWRVDATLTTVADTATLSLTPLLPELTELVDIISMKPVSGGATVKPKTQAWLDVNEADWRADTALTAKYYVLNSDGVLRLVPTPTSAVSYYVRAAVKPTQDVTDVSDLVVNKYSEALISGAKAYLFMQPRKPWTDLNMAQYHRAAFLAAIPEARANAADEFQTGVARKVKYGGY